MTTARSTCPNPSPRRSMSASASCALGAAWIAILLAGGCTARTTLDRNAPRTITHAIESTESAQTELWRHWASAGVEDPEASSFRLLGSNLEAVAARVAIIDLAERTLDLQYYIFAADDTGLFIAERLLAAADRGVRVRLLLDDMYAHGAEATLIAFDAHPGIEVRLFNPWTKRGGMLERGGEWLLTPRLNHRMHNKLFIGDGIVGVFGGRNIADEYFDLNEDFDFKDLDVAAAGPVVAQGSALFDAFWNGPDAIPLSALDPPPDPEEPLATAREGLSAHRERMRDSAYAKAVRDTPLVRELGTRSGQWIAARGTLLADSPDKTHRAGERDWSGSLAEAILPVVRGAEREFLASSPYFVPRAKGCEAFAALAARGVEVTILTNSFAANDVPMVHAAYARHRPRLVRDGIHLYELRRRAVHAGEDGQEDGRAFGSANASLHAKTFVVDRQRVFIGSLNLDPRSFSHNTELGVLIESPELAEAVAQKIVALTAPEWSYEVAIGPLDELVWIGAGSDGRPAIQRHDPDTNAWQRFTSGLLGLIPIEDQL